MTGDQLFKLFNEDRLSKTTRSNLLRLVPKIICPSLVM
jgi:hypothetical protein